MVATSREIEFLYAYAIRVDGGTQSRAALDEDRIEEYKQAMLGGAQFPPLVVAYDGTEYWLVDGFHRLEASRRADLEQVKCEVHQATQDDARWMSCAVNATHGLNRTNADKRRAVTTALNHPKAAGLSDRAIAAHCGVGHVFVASIRREIAPTGIGFQLREPRTGIDGKTRKLPVPPALRWPVPGEDGYYDDGIGIVRLREAAGGMVSLRALQVGERRWLSAYTLALTGLSHKERLSQYSDVHPGAAEAFAAAAKRASARLRLAYVTVDESKPTWTEIRLLLAWLGEQGAPADLVQAVTGAANEPEPEDDYDPVAPEGGWPEPNEHGVYPRHPSMITLTWEGPPPAHAAIHVMEIEPDWYGPRWISAFTAYLAHGGTTEQLTVASRELTQEDARRAAALRLAVWLAEHEKTTKVKAEVRTIAALREWAVEQGADLLEIEEARRRQDEARLAESRQNVLNVMEGLDCLRCGFKAVTDYTALARMIEELAEDPDDELAVECLRSIDLVAEQLRRLVAAIAARKGGRSAA